MSNQTIYKILGDGVVFAVLIMNNILTRRFLYAGCCTSCAVRIKSGQIRQPEALGISAELKSKAGIIAFLLG